MNVVTTIVEVYNYLLAGMTGYRALAANYSAGWGVSTRGMHIIMHRSLIGFSVKFGKLRGLGGMASPRGGGRKAKKRR